MARRRYISTEMGRDDRVNRLAVVSDFAALLYTWMIPHADMLGRITGDPEEIMFTIIPGRRDKTCADVCEAIHEMELLGLIKWDQVAKVITLDPDYLTERRTDTGRHRTWRNKVLERDGYRCTQCGAVNVPLTAHHLKFWASHPDDRYNVDNGVTLCRACHKDAHRGGGA